MCDRQTPDRHVIRTLRPRGFCAARCVTLLVAAGLLCAGLSTSASGAGSDNYEKMWQQTFSAQQWLQMLRQRVHQPMAVWHGVGTGLIEADGTSFSSSGLNFENSRSRVFEKQLQENGLMAKHPLVFLSLFDDQDPETVLTGAAAYIQAQFYGDVKPQALDKAIGAQIAAAVRNKLLPHRDVRIRAAAIAILGKTNWMMPADIAKGLDDQTNEIRIMTISCVEAVRSKWSWEADPDNTDEPNTPERLTPDQFRQRDAQLAEILLAHLNDTHFNIRQTAAGVLRWTFMRRTGDLQKANPTQKRIKSPQNFDWVRSEWQQRATTQETWTNWWKQYGESKPETP